VEVSVPARRLACSSGLSLTRLDLQDLLAAGLMAGPAKLSAGTACRHPTPVQMPGFSGGQDGGTVRRHAGALLVGRVGPRRYLPWETRSWDDEAERSLHIMPYELYKSLLKMSLDGIHLYYYAGGQSTNPGAI
jgi:hypothetical protein